MTAERALRKILFLGCCVLEKESMSSFARSLKPSVSHTSIASVLDGKIKSGRISADSRRLYTRDSSEVRIVN